MFKALSKLWDYYIGPPIRVPTEESVKKERKRLIRQIVANVASGNVLLTQGVYTTRKDLEELRSKNMSYDYSRSK